MIKILKQLFKSEPEPEYSELLKNGGIIIDVRSKNEYAMGHIKGSKNIPLNSLPNAMGKLKKKDQPIITCCASGRRSSSAKSILRNHGYTDVHNGGGWRNLKNKLS